LPQKPAEVDASSGPCAHEAAGRQARPLGNFAAMGVAGLAAVLMGGCPLRQLVMAGEGDADAGGALAGMFAGALVVAWRAPTFTRLLFVHCGTPRC
jgi:hypothetical protein